MAQDLDLIVELLREMRRTNAASAENFDRLLSGIGSRLDVMDKNSASADFIKAYLKELIQAVDDKYSTTLTKFYDIENAMKSLFDQMDEHVKTSDMRELFDVFSKSINNFYSEARQQKAILSAIEVKVSDLSADKSDKEDILRTITLLRNDFENLNHSYKNTIDSINSDLKNILSNVIKSEQNSTAAREQIEIMLKAVSDVVNYLNSIDKRDANLEKLLSNTATSESLKFTQGVLDSIVKKSEEISVQLNELADKSDIEGLQTAAGIMNRKLDETASKELFALLSSKTDDMLSQTNDIKQALSQVTKDIENLPDIKFLAGSLQELFNKLQSLENDLNIAGMTDNISDLNGKILNLNSELSTVKNIIDDLYEISSSKLITLIEGISFENECYDIKNHVSKMLAMLPQKEDIDKILENNELSQNTLEELLNRTDKIADSLDNLPTHDDMAALNSNQLSLVENLQDVATKDDIEDLSGKADELEDMIDKLNFDDEFEHLYDKTASIEDWLEKSQIKENTQDILAKMPDKAEQKDVVEILKFAEKIVSDIEELSNNVDVKKVNRTVAEVYSMIEDLKNDFINTNEMHHDSVIVQLSELQKSITKVTTVEDFNNFVEDLKSFVESAVETNAEFGANLAEIKAYQETIIEKLNNLNTSAIEETITKQAAAAGSKLTSLSEYLTNLSNTNKKELQQSISEIVEILENKKSNYDEIEKTNAETISSVENYLKEIKTILDTSDKALNNDVAAKISALEDKILTYQVSTQGGIADILAKVRDYQALLEAGDGVSTRELNNSIAEIAEIKEQINALSETFAALSYEKNSAESTVSEFVADKLKEISVNLDTLTSNTEGQLQQGFAYNAELIEEKTAALLEFIKELRHDNSDNIELFERLTVTDNKLIDFKQEMELINTDIINNLNSKTEELLNEITPIRQMLENINLASATAEETEVKDELEDIHDSVQEDLAECTKYSQSTFNMLEDTYSRINESLSATENNLRDFILGDIDSVIIKIDSLRADLDDALNRISPPEADAMGEFRKFVNEINEFKAEQKSLILDAAEDVKTSISETLNANHEELKSILAVSINNEEIIAAIEDLKSCFKNKIKDLKRAQETSSALFSGDEFSTNQYEEAFEVSENIKIIDELKDDFNKFSELISNLSEENPEVNEVLGIIRGKMESLSVVSVPEQSPEIIEITEDITDSDDDAGIEAAHPDYDVVDEDDSEPNSDTEDDDKDEKEPEREIIVGSNNFDILKALDLLKQDIQKLHNDVEKVISKDELKEASATLKSVPTLGNNTLLINLNNKIDLLAKSLNKDWLEEINTYLAGSEIHSMLEEISGKIDILTLSDQNSAWIDEIKQALEQLNSADTSAVADANKQIHSMLSLINEKIDILASSDDYDVMEDVREALERMGENESVDIQKQLSLINEKVDILAASDNNEDFEDIKDALYSLEAKLDEVPSNAVSSDDFEDIKESLTSIEEKLNSVQQPALLSDDFDDIKVSLTSIEEKLNSAQQPALSSDDFEDIRDSLSSIEAKLDEVPPPAVSSADIDDIKYTLVNVDEKVDGVKKLSEADAKITAMLETLNHKIDTISSADNLSSKQDVEDVKHLILAQMDYIEKFEKNNKTDAFKKCLKELTLEVNNLNTSDNTKQIQKTLKEMKESIMAAVVTIFEQVSFIEESEDIKDFVEEKTDEINENLTAVTKQLKQITSADEDGDYTYSMQDIESDLAKLRLALNNAQASEQEIQAHRLSFILDNINQIGNAVEDLQDSISKDDFIDIKTKFDRINTDIKSLNAVTNQLLKKSGESYDALTEHLSSKVDNVTKLLENSNASDKVMRQALIYMGEWIDSASASMNKISTNSDEIVEVKAVLNGLKSQLPEQTDILSSLEEKFDEQQERLKFFEKQISKLGSLEDRFDEQQQRIDRLEMSIEKILSAVEDIDDSKVTRKIDKIDKQIAKLSTNIEKLASYVD